MYGEVGKEEAPGVFHNKVRRGRLVFFLTLTPDRSTSRVCVLMIDTRTVFVVCGEGGRPARWGRGDHPKKTMRAAVSSSNGVRKTKVCI